MKEVIEKVLRPIALDENVPFVGVYRVDGVPIYIHFKDRRVLSLVDWLESQVKVLINYIASDYFKNAEFRMAGSHLLLSPISKTLVLAILASEDASIYKLKIDIESIKSEFEKHV